MNLVERVKRFVRGTQESKLARYQALLPKIADYEPELKRLPEHELRKRSLSLRHRAKSQEPLNRLLPEAYALVREAARRTVGMRHFDVQILGGIAMHHHSIVEMQTGEGKTLAATLPVYLNALSGRGVHVATSNSYLARRDAEWMGPIYALLGLCVGVIEPSLSADERRQAYGADVTYGTGNEFGFDFLKDRLSLRQVRESLGRLLDGMLGASDVPRTAPMQRGTHFAVVDEADSILIDAANTPLILSARGTEKEIAKECYGWSARIADQLEDERHYVYDPKRKTVELTTIGRRLVRSLPKPPLMESAGVCSIYEYVERAVRVNRTLFREQHYVVRNDEIVLIHEYSGRPAESVKWSGGVHQAVEAKERIPVTAETAFSARITVQDFFLRYERLAGMTGTASNSARELRRVYHAGVVRLPANRPPIRRQWPTRVFPTKERKQAGIIAEVRDLHATGRPILIGARSIESSADLSEALAAAGIAHQVLNAYRIADEAAIVASAGERGRVTVATNMAGRGTDIKLGPGVSELGGLHVILTEMHEAARIDRQLIGRCGRQGDPGSYRQCLALDDEILLAGLGSEQAEFLKELGRGSPRSFDYAAWLFRKAQGAIERRNYRDRRTLMAAEKERKKLKLQMGLDPYLD